MIGPAAASTFIRHSPAITAQLALALRSRSLELRHVYDTLRRQFPELVENGQLVDSLSDVTRGASPTVNPAVVDLQQKLDASEAENRRLAGENAALQARVNDLTSKSNAAATTHNRTLRDLTATRQKLAHAVGFIHWLRTALFAVGDSVGVIETKRAEERAVPFSNPCVASRALAQAFSSLTAKEWLFILDTLNRKSVPAGVVVLAQILPSVTVPLAVDATAYANREREICGHINRVRSVTRLAVDNFTTHSSWGPPSHLRELGAPTDEDRRCRAWLKRVNAALADDGSANTTCVISPLTLVVARPPATPAVRPTAAAGSRSGPARTSNLAAILNPPAVVARGSAKSESDAESELAFDDDAPSANSDDQAESPAETAPAETAPAPSRKRSAAAASDVSPPRKSAKGAASTASPAVHRSTASVSTTKASSTSVSTPSATGTSTGTSLAIASRTSSSSSLAVSRHSATALTSEVAASSMSPASTSAGSGAAASTGLATVTSPSSTGPRVFGFAGWVLRAGSTKTVVYHQVPCSATNDNDGYPNLAIFTGAVEYRTDPAANPGFRWDGASVQAFMKTEPWKLTLNWNSWIHVFILFDPQTLSIDLLAIAGRLLVLQRDFAPEYWARYHWLTIPRGKPDPKVASTLSDDLLRAEYDSRKHRCEVFFEVYRSLIRALKVGAEAAARRGEDREPWDYLMWEPALWFLPPHVCLVIPPAPMTSAAEITTLIARVDREEPLRIQLGGDPAAFANYAPSTLPDHLRRRLRDHAAGSPGYPLPPYVADDECQALREVSALGHLACAPKLAATRP